MWLASRASVKDERISVVSNVCGGVRLSEITFEILIDHDMVVVGCVYISHDHNTGREVCAVQMFY